MCPVAIPLKPSANGQKVHYQSPVESDVKAPEIVPLTPKSPSALVNFLLSPLTFINILGSLSLVGKS